MFLPVESTEWEGFDQYHGSMQGHEGAPSILRLGNLTYYNSSFLLFSVSNVLFL
jgi:hypothetical protein